MVRSSVLRWVACCCLVFAWAGALNAADDFETDLLRKFKKQNQMSAEQVKSEIEKNLADAFAVSATNPEKAMALVRQSKDLLAESHKLSKSDREALAASIDDAWRDANARLESLMAAKLSAAPAKPAKPLPDDSSSTAGANPDKKIAVSPIVFNPIYGLVPSSAAVQVTPIVSPDRRWVRISFRGAFFMVR